MLGNSNQNGSNVNNNYSADNANNNVGLLAGWNFCSSFTSAERSLSTLQASTFALWGCGGTSPSYLIKPFLERDDLLQWKDIYIACKSDKHPQHINLCGKTSQLLRSLLQREVSHMNKSL